MALSNTTSSSNSGATAPDITLASLSAQISSLHALLTALLVLFILGLCALLLWPCFQRCVMQKNHSSRGDVEAARTIAATSPTTTDNSLRTTTHSQPRNNTRHNPYGGFEDVPLSNMPPPQAHLRAARPSGSSTSNTNNSNNVSSSSRLARLHPNQNSRDCPPTTIPLPDPRYAQSVGTDYNRVRRAGRYTDEHLNGTGLAGSAHPHHHNAGVSAGSRRLDRIMNA